MFVIINNAGMKISVGVNVKNYLIKAYVIRDLFGILVSVNANAINLDYENSKCRKKLVDKIVEECTENIEETKLVENENKHDNKCSSCTLFILLFSLSFVINIGIDIYFVYSRWYLKKDIHALCLILTLRQELNRHINGRSQRNKH